METTLIYPFEGKRRFIYCPPQGIATLYAGLKNRGRQVLQMDLQALLTYEGDSLPEFDLIDISLQRAGIQEDGLVGFSLMGENQVPWTLKIAKRVHENYGARTVLGGSYVGNFKSPLLKNPYVDFIVEGKGEIPLEALVTALENGEKLFGVPNLTFKSKGGEITSTPKVDFHEESCPNFGGLDFDHYRAEDNLNVVPYTVNYGGCKNRCSFCTYPNQEKFRSKDHRKVISDLRRIRSKIPFNFVDFNDSNINADPKALENICDLLGRSELNFEWVAMSSVSGMTEDLLRKMYSAGSRELRWGIESGSPKILKSMRKPFNVERAEEVLRTSTDIGIKNHVFLMTGYPHETERDFELTKDFLKRNAQYIYSVLVSPFQLQLGSDIWKNPDKYGVRIMKPFNEFSILHEFEEVGGLSWDSKQNRQQMRRNELLDCAVENGISIIGKWRSKKSDTKEEDLGIV